ncbi:hypothetical protein BJ912DRAFT_1042879 [Pholiota molesta]|nr:hypothetical protein BJ912DRAFT_1042879 [Pholiota molesta]
MEALSLFDSVPNELISMILKKAVETYSFDPEAICVTPQTDISILASVLFVCKRWMYIMLNEPGVWAAAIDVDSSDLGSIRYFARLAKKTPLAILSDTTSECVDITTYDKRLLEMPNWVYVFTLIQRWGVFSLWASIDADNTNPLFHALTHPAPNLESFQIYNVWYPEPDDTSDDLDNRLFVLPDNLFSGQSPRLKEFAIKDAYLRSTFNFTLWKDVTELHVDLLLGGLQGDKISSRKWLHVLRDMKQLRVLSLGWTYHSGPLDDIVYLLPRESDRDRRVENTADVHLDHLQSLTLLAECEWNIMFDIFPKLVVPDACCTSITLGHTHWPDREPQFDWLTVGLDRRVTAWRAAVDTPFRICLINIHGSEFGFEMDVDTKSVQTMEHTFKFTHEACFHDEPVSELNTLDLLADFHEMSRVLQPILETSVVQFFEGEDEDSEGEGED